MTIQERETEIVEEFELFDDWMQKYEYLIDLGKDTPSIPDELKTPERIIEGCQSRVWVNAEMQGDKMRFTADSDAIITKGIIGLLIRVLDNQKPADIATADLTFINKIGLHEHLSPTRSNGLVSMVKRLKIYAIQHLS